MSEKTVTDGHVVTFQYTLSDGEGAVLDASSAEQPLIYLHGADNIVPGLERRLAGHQLGDSIDAIVPPAEGYGEREGEGPQPVPRSSFPADVELFPGMQFVATGPEEGDIPLWITSLDDETVHVDINHPLAGVELHFKILITGIRAATASELEHGHTHGADGHHDH